MTITSPTNDRVKDLVRLRDRRHRDRTGRFLVEGIREVSRALDAGVEVECVYVCPTLARGEEAIAVARRASDLGIEVVEMTEPPFRKAAYRTAPEGVLAVAERLTTDPEVLVFGPAALVLVAERIEKPGNLGTMLRTADAVGADAVIVADPATDPFNPNVVRASTGTLFTVPVGVGPSETVIDVLRRRGVSIVVTAPDAGKALWDVDLTGPTAIVVGTERDGLSRTWIEAADVATTIPMQGAADSLNAAMAAGVALFEAVRQRRAARA